MEKRKKLWVDSRVQGALVVRLTWYGVMCILLMTAQVLLWRMIASPTRQPLHIHFQEMWAFYSPTILAAGTLIPVIAWDMLRLSHRFVGPMLRLRNEMRRLAKGETVQPIQLRKDDFWHDSAEAFNALLARVQGPTGSSTDSSEESIEPKTEPETVGSGIE